MESSIFHYNDFSALEQLTREKGRHRQRVSCIIPTLNEAKTLAPTLRIVQNELMQTHGLVDELVVMDGGSKDDTRAIARDEGAQVYCVPQDFADEKLPKGKGVALWKGIECTTGDCIVCIDADISNIHAGFVYGIVGPLLMREDIDFVKAFYRRPLQMGATRSEYGGGRVTEILVRPFFSAFYPEASHFLQPLSGEYAFRRELIESIPFASGYGVETLMLLSILDRVGLSRCAQVNLEVRHHRNRTTQELGRMSFGIMGVLFDYMEKKGIVALKDTRGDIMHSLGENDTIITQTINDTILPPLCEYAQGRQRSSRMKGEANDGDAGK